MTYRKNAPRIEDAPTPDSMMHITLQDETLAYYDDVSARLFAGLVARFGTGDAKDCARWADEATVEMVAARKRRIDMGIFVKP